MALSNHLASIETSGVFVNMKPKWSSGWQDDPMHSHKHYSYYLYDPISQLYEIDFCNNNIYLRQTQGLQMRLESF